MIAQDVYTPDEEMAAWRARQPEVHTAPITARLMQPLAAFERSMASAYAAGALLVLGGALLGWYMRGLWGPIWGERGWAALVVFSIVGSSLIVSERNKRA